jgi:hypothetical protein
MKNNRKIHRIDRNSYLFLESKDAKTLGGIINGFILRANSSIKRGYLVK